MSVCVCVCACACVRVASHRSSQCNPSVIPATPAGEVLCAYRPYCISYRLIHCGLTPQRLRDGSTGLLSRPPLQPEAPILRETAEADDGLRGQYPTPPFTPRPAGSYQSSYLAGLSETWSGLSGGYASYRPRTVHGHGHQRVTRRFFVGSGALQPDRAQGRERVVEKTTVGCPKHYDVLVDDDDGLEYSGDHVRYRYIDFLTSRPLADGAAAAQTFESVQAVAKWLDTSHPYTRLDAYPLFILAKDVIRRLLRHELHSHDNEKMRIALEHSQLKAKIAELTRTTSAQIAELTKRCADLTKDNHSLNDLKLKAENEWTALQGDFADHKLATQQAADDHSMHLAELQREIEEQRRQHRETHDKLKQELAAAHTFDENAVKSTLQNVLNDLDEFSADGRDHHEDKLLLLRRLCCTFSLQEHADVLKAFFFSLGNFDVTQLANALRDDQRAALLQSLLADMDPAALLGHLAVGNTKLTDTATAMLREALAKGCDIDAILALLESEIPPETLMAKLRGEMAQVGTQCELVSSSGVQSLLNQPVSVAEPAISVPEDNLPPVSKHLRFLHKQHEGAPSLHLMKAHSMIGEIYEQKALSDQTDDINNHRRKPIAEFLRHWALHQFGLRSIADKNLAALITTVRENEALALAQTEGKSKDHNSPDYDMRLRTFGYLSGILSSPHEHTELPVNFCVDFLRRCVAQPSRFELRVAVVIWMEFPQESVAMTGYSRGTRPKRSQNLCRHHPNLGPNAVRDTCRFRGKSGLMNL